MKNNVSQLKYLVILFLIIFCWLWQLPASAKNPFLETERQYEPVALYGDWLALSGAAGSLENAPIHELYMYAYDAEQQQWQMMPFQIDERVLCRDPINPGIIEHMYFEPDTLAGFDQDDELVFMVRDLGDPAPRKCWIDNADSKNYPRLEICMIDPHDANLKAYGYLFRSATIAEDIPRPYGFAKYDAINHIIQNNYYSVRLGNETGLVVDISMKPPFGTGVDIFDTQKIRFAGFLDFGGMFTLPIGRDGGPAADERNIGVIPEDEDSHYLKYTRDPIVRFIRQVRQSLVFGQFYFDMSSFFVATKFYPYSGTLEGGAKLHPDSLKDEWDTDEDWIIEFDLLRQSWDFSEQAAGMKFYNRYNQDISIDGIPDHDLINKKIDVPIYEWSLVTGDQGTMFTHLHFDDTEWNSVELYWHDDKNGGTGDGTIVIDGTDSGDQDTVSYGDQGVIFRNLEQRDVSLELGFTAYFLPGNLANSVAEKLAHIVENPLDRSSALTGVVNTTRLNLPGDFELGQNFPNPFNHSTQITFRLPGREHVMIKIMDINGRTVTTLANGIFAGGIHTLRWDGKDSRNSMVASGVYFYELYSKNYHDIKKLMLLQ